MYAPNAKLDAPSVRSCQYVDNVNQDTHYIKVYVSCLAKVIRILLKDIVYTSKPIVFTSKDT